MAGLCGLGAAGARGAGLTGAGLRAALAPASAATDLSAALAALLAAFPAGFFAAASRFSAVEALAIAGSDRGRGGARALFARAQERDDGRQDRDEDDHQEDRREVLLHHGHVAEEVPGAHADDDPGN